MNIKYFEYLGPQPIATRKAAFVIRTEGYNYNEEGDMKGEVVAAKKESYWKVGHAHSSFINPAEQLSQFKFPVFVEVSEGYVKENYPDFIPYDQEQVKRILDAIHQGGSGEAEKAIISWLDSSDCSPCSREAIKNHRIKG